MRFFVHRTGTGYCVHGNFDVSATAKCSSYPIVRSEFNAVGSPTIDQHPIQGRGGWEGGGGVVGSGEGVLQFTECYLMYLSAIEIGIKTGCMHHLARHTLYLLSSLSHQCREMGK